VERRILFLLCFVLALTGGFIAGPSSARADDPDFFSFGAGVFDFNDNKTAAMGAVEYRSDKKYLFLKPFGGFMMNGDRGRDIYLGVLMDIFFGRRLVVTPNFAPSLYWKGTSGKDLGHPLEFRSGLEIAYRFDDRSRLGLAVHHLSNASISDDNPGTELLTLYYSLPMDGLFGK
jgi:hypothetical protein